MKTATTDEIVQALVVLSVIPPAIRADDGVGVRIKSPCHSCAHARSHPGDAHLLCSKPSAVKAKTHGIERGWFMYPLNFDPVWRTTECENFEPRESVQSVTPSVEQRA